MWITESPLQIFYISRIIMVDENDLGLYNLFIKSDNTLKS